MVEQAVVWPTTYVRENFRDALDLAAMGYEVIVTRNEKPVAVILSYEDYKLIADILEAARLEQLDRQAAQAILEWEDSRDDPPPCEFEYVGIVGDRPQDIWRCTKHRYNFFHKRGEEPKTCPVFRGEVG